MSILIVDAHTHRYPEEVRNNPTAFAIRQKENHWLELVKPAGKKSLQGWVSGERMQSDMQAANVSQAVLQGWYWENPSSCKLQNDWYARWILQDPEKFIGFVSIHPKLDQPIDELKKRQDQGFSGIGECHPWVQGSSVRNKQWISCMEFACQQGWPVTFHVTEPVGHDYPGRVATPFEDFIWLSKELPELKIILAHAGGLFPFYELNSKLRPTLKNFYYDLSACPLLYDHNLYRKLLDVVGINKLLWGTDYPLRIFPKIQEGPDFITFKNVIKEEALLTDAEESAIFGKNFLSLLPC
jgi:predicted TIM-barrel fold metal-dependent hydrolase